MAKLDDDDLKAIKELVEVTFDEKLDALIDRRRQMATDFLAPMPSEQDLQQAKKNAAAARIGELKEKLEEALAREREIEGELHGLKGERLKLLEKTLVLQREADQAERERDKIEARRSATASARNSLSVMVSMKAWLRKRSGAT